MRLILLLVAAIAAAAPAAAQGPQASSAGGTASAPQDAAELPVSLDRIRDGLKKAPEQPLLRNVERTPDFSVEIAEQARIDALMSRLDFTSGPAPAGGLYAYEQQRRLFSPTSRPLQQPYAAFSGGEFITIAIENLLGRYFGSRIGNAIEEAGQSRAERDARAEVDQSIADYCAGRPDRADIVLCTSPPDR